MYEYKPSRPFIIEALRLRFEAGLSYRQIGEQLDLGMSAVHKLVQRFLRANLMWPLDESWTADKLELTLYPSTRPRPDSDVQQRRPNYSNGFKLHLVELTMKPGVSVAQVARANDINANLLFNWRHQYKLGKLTSDNQQGAAFLPVVLSPEKAPEASVPATGGNHRQTDLQNTAASTLTCELLLPAGTLRLSGTITAAMLQALVRELGEVGKQ
ncbi:MAG: IS66-like element accessory protein TnpA [Burkholderia sp.]